MAQFQVVAIGETTGTRFAVREPWDSFLRAAAHLGACRAAFPGDAYEIDMTRTDGSVKRNVQPEDLGYPESEYVGSLQFGGRIVRRLAGARAGGASPSEAHAA